LPALLMVEERARIQGETHELTQQRMLREMAEALAALTAERPLVLLLEDLHWSDASTLDLIAAIARRTEPAQQAWSGVRAWTFPITRFSLSPRNDATTGIGRTDSLGEKRRFELSRPFNIQ
jgi:hypothetical protein